MRFSGRIADEEGASAVEFALILPVLMLLLVGLIQFGIVFHSYISITHAAREGVRWAALGWSEADIKQKAVSAAPSIDLKTEDVAVSIPDPSPGQPATVSVSYTVPVFTPLMQATLGTNLTLESSATQRIE